MTEREIDDLFSATLEGSYDDDPPWDAVKKLRTNGNQSIFEKASKWCQSAEPLKRARGSDILCQLRFPKVEDEGEAKRFPNDRVAIESLMKLSEDPDDDVRDWAMFALASQSEADSQALRELFIRHLEDPNPEVEEEAIAGLAKRRDPRAALPLLRLMESGSYHSHHHHDFIALVGEDPDLEDWGTDDFIDALYSRFPDVCQPDQVWHKYQFSGLLPA